MSSMTGNSDPHLYPGTSVLKNLRGLTDPNLLQRFEVRRTHLRIAELIDGFRFHDLRHTFASWYMMNGGDLYELAKIRGHSNTKIRSATRNRGKRISPAPATPHAQFGS